MSAKRLETETKAVYQIEPKRTAGLVEISSARTSPVGAYLSSLSEGSRRGQETALLAVLAIVESRDTKKRKTKEEREEREEERERLRYNAWHSLTAAHTNAIRAALQERHSPAYANKCLSALRGVLKAAWRLELMSQEDYSRAADLEPIRGETLPAGRDLASGEIAGLMLTCSADPGPAGARDAALISLAYTTGLRVDEAAGLDLEDFDPATDRLVIRGKGNKERPVFATNGARDALEDWLIIRGSEPGPLFWRVRKGGKLEAGRLSTNSLRRMLEKRATQAGVKSFTWHDFRRTCIGDLLDAGEDLVTVQKLVGHSDPATTARYDRRPEEKKRQASAKLHVPYVRRERAKGRSKASPPSGN